MVFGTRLKQAGAGRKGMESRERGEKAGKVICLGFVGSVRLNTRMGKDRLRVTSSARSE